jgi:hypothetical protein
MFKVSDIVYCKARSAYFLILKKFVFDNEVKGYILLDLVHGKHIHTTAPRGLYRKVA